MGIEYEARLVYGWVFPAVPVLEWPGVPKNGEALRAARVKLHAAGLPDEVSVSVVSAFFDASVDDMLVTFNPVDDMLVTFNLASPVEHWCAERHSVQFLGGLPHGAPPALVSLV